jgi:hypothetical protein
MARMARSIGAIEERSVRDRDVTAESAAGFRTRCVFGPWDTEATRSGADDRGALAAGLSVLGMLDFAAEPEASPSAPGLAKVVDAATTAIKKDPDNAIPAVCFWPPSLNARIRMKCSLPVRELGHE